MIPILISLITLFYKPESNYVLVARVEIYMDRENTSFRTETTFATDVFLSDCDVLFYLVKNKEDLCNPSEIEDILRVRRMIEPDTLTRQKGIY